MPLELDIRGVFLSAATPDELKCAARFFPDPPPAACCFVATARVACALKRKRLANLFATASTTLLAVSL